MIRHGRDRSLLRFHQWHTWNTLCLLFWLYAATGLAIFAPVPYYETGMRFTLESALLFLSISVSFVYLFRLSQNAERHLGHTLIYRGSAGMVYVMRGEAGQVIIDRRATLGWDPLSLLFLLLNYLLFLFYIFGSAREFYFSFMNLADEAFVVLLLGVGLVSHLLVAEHLESVFIIKRDGIQWATASGVVLRELPPVSSSAADFHVLEYKSLGACRFALQHIHRRVTVLATRSKNLLQAVLGGLAIFLLHDGSSARQDYSAA